MSTQNKIDITSGRENSTYPVQHKNQKNRPNIDNLIKRIIVERRREKKKALIVFAVISLLIISIFFVSF
tara:strand:- start:3538 stop:3744 length:207 start_codon:yes stop_codon:yes gene_type:complete